jgi:hypothetical protein
MKHKRVTRRDFEQLAAVTPTAAIRISTPFGDQVTTMQDAVKNFDLLARYGLYNTPAVSDTPTFGQGVTLSDTDPELNTKLQPVTAQRGEYIDPKTNLSAGIPAVRMQAPQKLNYTRRIRAVNPADYPADKYGIMLPEFQVHSTQTFYVVTGLILTILLLAD